MHKTDGSTQGPPSLVILITGVGKGMGRALAVEFAKRGHTIIGCSRTQNKLDSIRIQLSAISDSSRDKHLLLNVDVTSDASVEDLVRAVLERNLVPDILVNNTAIINEKSKFWEIPRDEFDSVIDTNIKGTTNVLRHFIPLMIAREKRIIVNMSSLWGRIGAPMVGTQFDNILKRENEFKWEFILFMQFSPYGASKWAIEGLTKSIAQEFSKEMAIIALDPGLVYTDMLVTSCGDLAANYQNHQQWAVKASTIILNFTTADNGATISVD